MEALTKLDLLDFFSVYVMGEIQMLTGFYFFTRLLKKRVGRGYYLLFALVGIVVIEIIPSGRIPEFLAYILMLILGGLLICHGDKESVLLYAVLTVVIMQLSYGIVNSLLSLLYPLLGSLNQRAVGLAFLLLGFVPLLMAAFCYRILYRYFLDDDSAKKQYVLMILTPILLLFLIGEYINSIIYGGIVDTKAKEIVIETNHGQMLVIQVLGLVSLFCIMFAYQKLLQNVRLCTKLSLLEQEERFLRQYVEEARSHYDKTRSFRHDVKNHVTVVRELLQKGNTEQALSYMGDMKRVTEELSFPWSTNNPAVDILVGNKLGIAADLGIEVSCSLLLPYPCPVRDMDFCIILSNALDNGIHACQAMEEEGEKYMYVTGRVQGDFILLEVENSFQGKDLPREGTGLSNIKAVAEKYHGAMSVKTQGGSFILSVLLTIP